MKHLLTIIVIVVIFQLFAQSDSDLDLGNVVIQGESSNLTDSVSYQRDFAFYNTVNSETELGFKPHFQPVSIPRQIPDAGSKLAFQALGGTSNTRMNAAYAKDEILNFSAEYDYHSIEKEWSRQNIAVSWQPQFQGFEWDVTISDLTIQDSIDQTNISSYDFRISTPSYSIKKNIPFELDLDFALAYLTSEQNSNNENDLNLSADITASSADYNSYINAEYLNQAFSGFSSFGLNELIFGKPQIWLGYDEIHLYPSLYFDRSFKIASGIEFQLANHPQISNQDRRADLNDNFFHSIKSNGLQEKMQLNAFVAFHNNNLLPFNLYYNPQHIKDKRMYIESQSGYYIQVTKDRFIQTFGAEFCWNFKELEIENTVRYQLCDKEIYYEPKLRFINSISRNYKSFFVDLEMNFLAVRSDDLGSEMDDYFQVNLNLEYKFKANVAFFGYAENLLDTDYSEYYVIPEEGITLYVGCRYGF
jgi:hypothetical protein